MATVKEVRIEAPKAGDIVDLDALAYEVGAAIIKLLSKYNMFNIVMTESDGKTIIAIRAWRNDRMKQKLLQKLLSRLGSQSL